MYPHFTLWPWTFTILLNALHLTLQRSTFFYVCFALGPLTLFTKFCCVTVHDENFEISLFSVMHWHKFHRSIVKSALRTLQSARFCREEVLHDEGMILFSAEAILASSASKFGIEIPRMNDEDLNSSTELTNSTSLIHCIAFRKKLFSNTYLRSWILSSNKWRLVA